MDSHLSVPNLYTLDMVLEGDKPQDPYSTGGGGSVVDYQDEQELPPVHEDDETEPLFENEGMNSGM